MRLILHEVSEDSGKEEVVIATPLFSFAPNSLLKFTRYQCIGLTWYNKKTGEASGMDEQIEDMIDEVEELYYGDY